MPTTPAIVTVGEEVRVFDVNGARRGQPEGGFIGTVTAVGRTLITIEVQVTASGRTESMKFRIDTGRTNDKNGHQRFKTLAEVASAKTRREALAVLHEFGLEPRNGREGNLSAELLVKLAAVVTESGAE